MFTPDRFHWYARVTGAGPHVPGTAVSFCPDTVVPVTVGTGAAVNASGGVPKESAPMSVVLPTVTAIGVALASAATFPE